MAESETERTYTNAPESYDGFGTRTIQPHAGLWRNSSVRLVETPTEHVQWQRRRYASGLYLALTEKDWEQFRRLQEKEKQA